VITYQLNNLETSTKINISAHRNDLSYNDIINEIKYHTHNLNVYLSLNSLQNSGLGKLINQLDLHRQPINDKTPKIKFLMDKYIDGYIKINQYGVNYCANPDKDETLTLLVEW